MRNKYVLFSILVLGIVYFSFFGCNDQPDILICHINGYKFGINFTDNLGMKFLAMIMLAITGILISSKENDEEESASE